MGTPRRLLLLLFVASACAARTELDVPDVVEPEPLDATSHDASHPTKDASEVDDVDTVDASDGAPSLFCTAPPDAGKGHKLCSVVVTVGAVIPSSYTCFVDTLVKQGDVGRIQYECDGKLGSAIAAFDGGAFTGAVLGTAVDLCAGSTFAFSDGCVWASAQRITGDLDSGVLAFTYDEGPISGAHCFPPCTAHASIVVDR